VEVARDLVGGSPDRMTQGAARRRAPACAGAVQRQPEEAGLLEGLVALGPAHALAERRAWGGEHLPEELGPEERGGGRPAPGCAR